jgi:chromosome segregation ATPase
MGARSLNRLARGGHAVRLAVPREDSLHGQCQCEAPVGVLLPRIPCARHQGGQPEHLRRPGRRREHADGAHGRLLEIDAQIAEQNKASANVQTQIDTLTKENADIAIKIKEQTDLIPIAQKEVTDLTAKIAAVTKQIDDFTIILNDSKAKLATLRADTVNATKNAVTITKLSTAISQLSSSITSLKTSNSTSKIQMQSVNGSISKYNSSIMQLKSTTNKNLASIENSKKISSNIATLNKTKELTSNQLKQAKDALTQTMSSRNLLCSAGL